jgi:glutathione S-transferase
MTPILSLGVPLAGLLLAAIGWWAWQRARRRTHPVPPGLQKDVSIPYQQEFELYHNALSLCSMKTRVCMAELGIPYQSHPIDLIETGAYENIRPVLLGVNPAGTVPVLVHEGHPVYESHEKIRYAAAHAPAGAPSLVPEDAESRAAMEDWIDRSSLTDDPLNRGDQSVGNAVPGLTVPLFATMIEKIATWKILEGLLFHFDKMRPVLFLVLKVGGIERIGGMRPLVGAVARSRAQVGVHLDRLEAQLAGNGGPWILGEAFTLADVSWLVIFERLRQVDAIQIFLGEGRRPACTAYWERLQARPSYAEAILGNSHPLIDYGLERIRQAKERNPELRTLLEGVRDTAAA